MNCAIHPVKGAECGNCRAHAEGECPWSSLAISAGRSVSRVRVLHSDEELFAEWEAPVFACMVLDGFLRREKIFPDGRRTILGVSGPGDLVVQAPESTQAFAIVAASEARLCIIDKRSCLRLIAQDGSFRRRMTLALTRECERTRDMIWCRGALKSHQRVISTLVAFGSVEDRCVDDEREIIVSLRLNRRDWAALASTSIETISRTVARLKRDRILEPVGADRFRILDIARLKASAGLEDEVIPAFEGAVPDVGRSNSFRSCNVGKPRRVASPVIRPPIQPTRDGRVTPH